MYAYRSGWIAPTADELVASADGAASADGGVQEPVLRAGSRVFGRLRRLAEVILVGAGRPGWRTTGEPASQAWSPVSRRGSPVVTRRPTGSRAAPAVHDTRFRH